jgi:hypothetical protein
MFKFNGLGWSGLMHFEEALQKCSQNEGIE